MCTVTYSTEAEKQLDKLDNTAYQRITRYVDRTLRNCEDPREHGEPLVGDRPKKWRYRVGIYRLISTIDQYAHTIEINEIKKRNNAYKKLTQF